MIYLLRKRLALTQQLDGIVKWNDLLKAVAESLVICISISPVGK